jgi:hypothetical protein
MENVELKNKITALYLSHGTFFARFTFKRWEEVSPLHYYKCTHDSPESTTDGVISYQILSTSTLIVKAERFIEFLEKREAPIDKMFDDIDEILHREKDLRLIESHLGPGFKPWIVNRLVNFGQDMLNTDMSEYIPETHLNVYKWELQYITRATTKITYNFHYCAYEMDANSLIKFLISRQFESEDAFWDFESYHHLFPRYNLEVNLVKSGYERYFESRYDILREVMRSASENTIGRLIANEWLSRPDQSDEFPKRWVCID